MVAAPAFADIPVMRVHVIDVGQGAATLLEFPCAAVLIDTGGEDPRSFDSSAALVAYLDRFFLRRPDLDRTLASLVLTHPHVDHTRGVAEVLQRYRIRNGIVNGRYGSRQNIGDRGQMLFYDEVQRTEETEETGDDIRLHAAWKHEIPARRGLSNASIDPVRCAQVDPKITLLWGSVREQGAWSKKAFSNQNNHSVVLRVDFGKASYLNTGDLQEEGIGGLMELHAGSRLLDVDLYHVGHHGSHNATTEALLRAMTPEIAVISTGLPRREGSFTANEHGHPRWDTVEKLLKHVRRTRPTVALPVAFGQRNFYEVPIPKAIYATGWDGTLVFEATVQGTWRQVIRGEEDPEELDDVGVQLVNLNTASQEELEALPMVGAARARAIVESRQRDGVFASVEALRRIRGIGPSTVEVLRHLVTTGR